jgi:hypothetical protein
MIIVRMTKEEQKSESRAEDEEKRKVSPQQRTAAGPSAVLCFQL